MKELINLARGFSQQFECALVYGIANVAQLDNLFKVNAKQFVIVEADPGVFSKLEEWHSALPETAPKVNCYHASITQEDTPTTLLYQASQPGFSSTAKPNQIKRFRPGLTFSSVSVPAKKLSYFTDKYAIAANQHNIALVNCNSAEHEILSDSTSQLFSAVIVKTTSKSLFGENVYLPKALTEIGYTQVNVKSSQPPMNNMALCRSLSIFEQTAEFERVSKETELYHQKVNDLLASNNSLTEQHTKEREYRLKNKAWAEQLQSQKQELTEQLAQSDAKIADLSEQLDRAHKELETKRGLEQALKKKVDCEQSKLTELMSEYSGITTKLEELSTANSALLDDKKNAAKKRQEIGEQIESVNTSLQEALIEKEEIRGRLDKAHATCKQLEANISVAHQEREQHKEHQQNNKKWAEELNASNKSLLAKIEHLEPQLNKLVGENKALSSQLENSEKREQQISSTLKLNTKLVAKMHSDNDHLREQYKEKIKSEEELKNLVSELHQKLQQAANFYHKLEQQYPELLSETLNR